MSDDRDGAAAPAAVNREAITLRPVTDADYPYLEALYRSTRDAELDQFPFSEEQKRQFIAQQFAAQTEHYTIHYPTARLSVIEINGQPIGRLYIDEWKSQIRIVDISLAANYRGTGIGTMLLREVLERGVAAEKPVTIHVEAYNPALQLYERLGFTKIDTNGVYFLMEWCPPGYVKTAS
jgi:ribosomal protein S18 acetylase RimI-like enzyme